MKKINACLMILGILLFPGFAFNTWAVVASTVTLVPASPTTDLVEGNFVTFDVIIDFSADGGTLGGDFDVVFDPTARCSSGPCTNQWKIQQIVRACMQIAWNTVKL